jgi:type II secretory pathway predicted ATPase ExeA
MKSDPIPTSAEFFGWSRHPFADTYPLAQPFLGSRDQTILRHAGELLSHGKSFALCGPAGVGKSTLVRHILEKLDPTYYRPVFVPYGGLNRGGVLRALADALGVETASRAVPLLVKVHKHIGALAAEQSRLHTVIAVDDAQMLESKSLFDLCALTAGLGRQTVAASLALAGDALLQKSLQLHVLDAVRTRLACVFACEPLTDKESQDFVCFRLAAAKAPRELFDRDALQLLAAHCRGNRRALMNAGTLLLGEAYFRQEKTVGPELVISSGLLQISG